MEKSWRNQKLSETLQIMKITHYEYSRASDSKRKLLKLTKKQHFGFSLSLFTQIIHKLYGFFALGVIIFFKKFLEKFYRKLDIFYEKNLLNESSFTKNQFFNHHLEHLHT